MKPWSPNFTMNTAQQIAAQKGTVGVIIFLPYSAFPGDRDTSQVGRWLQSDSQNIEIERSAVLLRGYYQSMSSHPKGTNTNT